SYPTSSMLSPLSLHDALPIYHIRSVCDRVAAAGYAAVAPALFDRIEPGFESGYSPGEISAAMRFVQNPDFGAFLRDTSAAIGERSEEHTSELQSRSDLVCRLL